MTDLGGVPAGDGAHRIGDTEREAAVAALNAHREAGRLDAVEYEDRQVRVSRARTWSDIEPAFKDLPEPHPVGMPGGRGATPPVVPAGVVGQVAPPSRAGGPIGGLVPARYRTTLMALAPFAALLLFLGTHLWEWFLVIPVMGILVYGPGGNADRNHRARVDRNQRRRIERDRRRGY